jgi:hypothetical protein
MSIIAPQCCPEEFSFARQVQNGHLSPHFHSGKTTILHQDRLGTNIKTETETHKDERVQGGSPLEERRPSPTQAAAFLPCQPFRRRWLPRVVALNLKERAAQSQRLVVTVPPRRRSAPQPRSRQVEALAAAKRGRAFKNFCCMCWSRACLGKSSNPMTVSRAQNILQRLFQRERERERESRFAPGGQRGLEHSHSSARLELFAMKASGNLEGNTAA